MQLNQSACSTAFLKPQFGRWMSTISWVGNVQSKQHLEQSVFFFGYFIAEVSKTTVRKAMSSGHKDILSMMKK